MKPETIINSPSNSYAAVTVTANPNHKPQPVHVEQYIIPTNQREVIVAKSDRDSFDSEDTLEKQEKPRNFRRALSCLLVILLIIGGLVGAVVYIQYSTKPAIDPSIPTSCLCGYRDNATGIYYTNYAQLDFTKLSGLSSRQVGNLPGDRHWFIDPGVKEYIRAIDRKDDRIPAEEAAAGNVMDHHDFPREIKVFLLVTLIPL